MPLALAFVCQSQLPADCAVVGIMLSLRAPHGVAGGERPHPNPVPEGEGERTSHGRDPATEWNYQGTGERRHRLHRLLEHRPRGRPRLLDFEVRRYRLRDGAW